MREVWVVERREWKHRNWHAFDYSPTEKEAVETREWCEGREMRGNKFRVVRYIPDEKENDGSV